MSRRMVLTAAFSLLLGGSGLFAATFTVNTTVDAPDASPGNGVCLTASGTCSLRAAIQEANLTADQDTIAFAVPGPGVHTFQTALLPAMTQPTFIDGFTQPGSQPNTNATGGLNGILTIELTGGLTMRGGFDELRGVVVNGGAIVFGMGTVTPVYNLVNGCYIGTDPTGTLDRSTGTGILFPVPGTLRMGNGSPDGRNLISGNDADGIHLACTPNVLACHPGSVIEGSLIGTDVSGTAPLPNGVGIRLTSSAALWIGGSSPERGNVISGNQYGILALGANVGEGISILGNRIGVDTSGAIAIPNGVGVFAGPACVGDPSCGPARVSLGDGPGTGNIIAHNAGPGIYIRSDGVAVSYNVITANGGDGIVIDASPSMDVGGIIWQNEISGNAGSGVNGFTSVMRLHILSNVVSSNARHGVELRAPADATTSDAWMERNSFSANGLLAIDLGGDGVTPNDPLDQDVGPNHLVNHPVLTRACASGTTLTVTGNVHTEPSTNVEVEFYRSASCDLSGYGEGEAFLGSDITFTDAAGDAPISSSLTSTVAPGTFITATALLIDTYARTSEFGACIPVFPATPPVQSVSGPVAVCAGTAFSLRGVPGAESYQWFRDGSPIAGAVGLIYTRAAAAAGDAGSYTVRASSCGSDTTSPAHALSVVTCSAVPVRVEVDSHAGTGTTSDLNRVLEAGESVLLEPRYLNTTAIVMALTGSATLTGPAPGVYALPDASAAYGTVAAGQLTDCFGATGDCYRATISGPRPQPHWDATLVETVTGGGDPARYWPLHIGETFADVPRANPFYRFVEALVHNGVTAGCSATGYCPTAPTSRQQMAVFALVAREGVIYVPPACAPAAPRFTDVPASSPFCRWIEELARRGVVSGCGPNLYCPLNDVPRNQMAVFVLATREAPGYVPAPCVPGAERFADVPASSPFCRWIEELARRNVVTGCGSGIYCPAAPVTRGEMSVFIVATFGLLLYGP